MDHVIALRQISVTALFYLENSRKIHLPGVRARWSKDAKRRAPQCLGEREREPFSSSFYVFFFSPPGPVLCKLGLVRSAVLSEVLTPVLRPSFDLSLFCFRRLLPSLSFSHRHFGLLFPILTTWQNFLGKYTGTGCHSYSRGSSWPRDQTWVWFLHWHEDSLPLYHVGSS